MRAQGGKWRRPSGSRTPPELRFLLSWYLRRAICRPKKASWLRLIGSRILRSNPLRAAGAENGYIGTPSDVSEHRRKDDHDDRRPHGIDRQVIRLPPFEARERSAPSQKAGVEHGGG